MSSYQSHGLQTRLLSTLMSGKRAQAVAIGIVLVILAAAMFYFGVIAPNVGKSFSMQRVPATTGDASVATGVQLETTTGSTSIEQTGVATAAGEPVVVYVTGAVKKPGLCHLVAGARIGDAIEKAGGATAKADLAQINLAAVATDAMHIHILKKGEKPKASTNEEPQTEASASYGLSATDSAPSASGSQAVSSGKVNINTADATRLQTLSGIGPATAAKIIEYRTSNGAFKSIEQLKNVSGIGDKKFAAVKASICI